MTMRALAVLAGLSMATCSASHSAQDPITVASSTPLPSTNPSPVPTTPIMLPVPVSTTPVRASTLTPTWTWVSGSGDANATFLAALDGPGVAPARVQGGAYQANALLRAGPHALYVREMDHAGNTSPVLIINLTVTASDTTLDTGDASACSVDANVLRCFGQVGSVPLSAVLPTDANSPAPAIDPNPGQSVQGVRVSHDPNAPHLCALLDTADVKCWGKNTVPQVSIDANIAGHAVDMVTSGARATVVLADGTMREYQYSGSNPPAATGPMFVLPGGGRPLSISGGDAVCVLSDTKDVWCWNASNGNTTPLSTGTLTDLDNAAPVSFGDDQDVLMVNAMGAHACAVMTDSSLRCTDGNTVTTVNLPGVTRPVQVSLDVQAGVALLDDGSVVMFQFDGTVVQPASPVAAGHRAVSVSALHADGFCLRQDDGAVHCATP